MRCVYKLTNFRGILLLETCVVNRLLLWDCDDVSAYDVVLSV